MVASRGPTKTATLTMLQRELHDGVGREPVPHDAALAEAVEGERARLVLVYEVREPHLRLGGRTRWNRWLWCGPALRPRPLCAV